MKHVLLEVVGLFVKLKFVYGTHASGLANIFVSGCLCWECLQVRLFDKLYVVFPSILYQQNFLIPTLC